MRSCRPIPELPNVTEGASRHANGASMKKFPVYCPLDFDFDRQRMSRELLNTRDSWRHLPTIKRFATAPYYFEVAAAEFYAKAEYVELDGTGGSIYHSGNPTWSGCSLTSTPRSKNSVAGSFGLRAKFDDWTWQPQFAVPYTRSVVERLPYTQIEIVRIMTIDAGGFGPVHVDIRNDELWEEKGYAATTFMLESGGTDMLIQRGDRRFAANAPAFFFKDCYPHGVPPVKSLRLLLRVTGKVDYPAYRKLMQLEGAVW
jgi:hypothetical protein